MMTDMSLGPTDTIAVRWSVALWAMVAVLLIVMAFPVLTAMVQPIDDAAWELAASWQRPMPVTAAEWLDVIGALTTMAVLMAAVAALLAWRRRWTALAAWLLAMASSQALSLLIKELYARPRPPLPLVAESGTGSFPSGQAVTATAVALTLVLLWSPAAPVRRAALALAMTYALAISISRVYLRVHWLTDVVAGLALGAACAISAVIAIEWWRDRSRQASRAS
jgi:undecaprenyl-diphosphatase